MNCDIIIPVWNQLAFTKDCIDSIVKNTAIGYKIIVIDNASDIDTKEYLDGLKKTQPFIEILRNEKNIGFVKAVNKGISRSAAPYVCILNNDTITTEGWLKTMMDIAESNPEIGIVNPSSNNLGQRPDKDEPLELYADRLKKGNLGTSTSLSINPEHGRRVDKFVELGAAIGFCMLIKRSVIDRIGVFDEVYGMGNFEDTDYSRRAVKEGYKCVRACGAYVYHRESSSFNKIRTFDEDFKRNKEIYEFRWGKPKRVAYILDSYDANTLKKLEIESLKLARSGDWISYYVKEPVNMPAHSNINMIEFKPRDFYAGAVLKILTKKKKYNAIYVGGSRLGRILEMLSFIHKAKVGYY